ncbi:MAG: hypothetical protein QXL94_03045 [Candidatus Parvarchaeum sp.]
MAYNNTHEGNIIQELFHAGYRNVGGEYIRVDKLKTGFITNNAVIYAEKARWNGDILEFYVYNYSGIVCIVK